MGAYEASEDRLAPFVASGQRRLSLTLPRPSAPEGTPPTGASRLLAGAAEADLTPPPGMPKAGYSSNANTGNGFRTRLRARVVHLRSGDVSQAVVMCDLLAGSAVVHRLVAERIARTTDIPVEGLMIGATHTHAGPGQILATNFYNRFASNRGGFDPAYTAFVVDRIADAVERAWATREPARLAVGSAAVWGLTRNRSLDPHCHNETVSDKRLEPQRVYAAVNPWLHLIRVDAEAPDGGLESLAAMVVFSVHGTGVSMSAREYNADLWSYLVGELHRRIVASAASGRGVVVGAMEGTHADVAPAIRPGLAGYAEARRVGRGIGEQAAELYHSLEGELSSSVALGAGLVEVDLDRSRSIDGITLPTRALVGSALIAGAKENVTPVIHRIPPFKAGTPRRRPSGEHGHKSVLGSRFLQPLILRRDDFPRVIPIQALRLGERWLVGLPFEITVETGRRIAETVAGVLPDGAPVEAGPGVGQQVDRVIVSSVVNEYCGYVTTPEEYRRQYYEGGHTLYGAATQPFLARHAARLVQGVVRRGRVAEVGERRVELSARRFLPEVVQPRSERRLDGAHFCEASAFDESFWETSWTGDQPGSMKWHEPLVRIEFTDGAGGWTPLVNREGCPADDSGWDLEVTEQGGHGDHHHYRVRWFNPELRGDRRYRFVLLPNNGGQGVAGQPFS